MPGVAKEICVGKLSAKLCARSGALKQADPRQELDFRWGACGQMLSPRERLRDVGILEAFLLCEVPAQAGEIVSVG